MWMERETKDVTYTFSGVTEDELMIMQCALIWALDSNQLHDDGDSFYKMARRNVKSDSWCQMDTDDWISRLYCMLATLNPSLTKSVRSKLFRDYNASNFKWWNQFTVQELANLSIEHMKSEAEKETPEEWRANLERRKREWDDERTKAALRQGLDEFIGDHQYSKSKLNLCINTLKEYLDSCKKQ